MRKPLFDSSPSSGADREGSLRAVSALAVLFGLALLVACGEDQSTPNDTTAGSRNLGGSADSGGAAGRADGGTGPIGGTSGDNAAAAASGAGEAGAGGQGADPGCGAYAVARCARYQACLPARFATLYASLADCEQATIATCANELSAPGTSRTNASLSACAADTSAQSCAEWQGNTPASCTLPGSLALDEGCEYSSQCQSTFCSRATGSWCGVCRARDSVGGACDAQQGSCVFGLRCAYVCESGDSCAATDKQYRCAKPKAQGVACGGPTECEAPLACLDGVCKPSRGVGQACDPISLDCEASADLSCVSGSTGATCVKNSFGEANAPCNIATASQCSGLGTCVRPDGHYISDGPGTCVPPGGPGEACSTDKLCRQPALCFGGVCTSPVDAGTCG